MSKLKTFLMQDIGWKLLSVIIATIMWVLVININQPIDTRTYTQKITLENIDLLTEEELTIAGLDDLLDTTVTLRVKAQRTALDRLAASPDWITTSIDFSALRTATAGDIVSLPVDVSIRGTTSESTYTVMSQSPTVLSVKIEELTEKILPIQIEINGSTSGEQLLSEPQLSQSTTTILGATSAIDKVVSVKGVLLGQDIQKEALVKIALVPYDEDGDEVIDVSLNPKEVTASFYGMAVKTIPITVTTTGTQNQNYDKGEIVIKPSSVMVQGETSLMENVYGISLPSISIEGATSDVIKNFYLQELLPEGIYLVPNESLYTEVRIPFVGDQSREFSVPSSQFELVSQQPDKLYEVADYAKVEIIDKAGILYSVNTALLKGDIDVEHLNIGEFELPIVFTENTTYKNITGTLTVQVSENFDYDPELEEGEESENEDENEYEYDNYNDRTNTPQAEDIEENETVEDTDEEDVEENEAVEDAFSESEEDTESAPDESEQESELELDEVAEE
ncbi:MAG: hypothetical protein R3Y53_01290 [Bacillota bacterium]